MIQPKPSHDAPLPFPREGQNSPAEVPDIGSDKETDALTPDPEVVLKKNRRQFSSAYKLRILEETDTSEWGEIGTILRREGLYYSQLQAWRKEREEGVSPKQRGRKKRVKSAEEKELEALRIENMKLKAKLEKAEMLIDIQKKISETLSIPLTTSTSNNDIVGD